MRIFFRCMGMAIASIILLASINYFAGKNLIFKKFVKLPFKGITEQTTKAIEKCAMEDYGYKLSAEDEGWTKGRESILRRYKDEKGNMLSIMITTEGIFTLRDEDGSIIIIKQWAERLEI